MSATIIKILHDYGMINNFLWINNILNKSN